MVYLKRYLMVGNGADGWMYYPMPFSKGISGKIKTSNRDIDDMKIKVSASITYMKKEIFSVYDPISY